MKPPSHLNGFAIRCITARGFALPTLMVMLALTSIATLLAIRNLWVNDQLLNAEADQLRTQSKAEAALPVALADILGTATNSNEESAPNLRHSPGSSNQTHAFFPNSMAEYVLLRQRINTDTCIAGICAPNALDTNATKASYWKTQITTAMSVSAIDTPYGDNTAWYWIEVFPPSSADMTTPSSTAPFIYRITALANGVMPSSNTVLQAIWVRNSPTTNTGQWRSWHVLHD
jgi:Tfp pilus assembly protein PilX